MEVLDDLQAALAGRYEILREVGRGGMAVVYLARDLKHEREVAIKVLPPEMATAVGAERFVREIRTAAQLAHPNILPLHDSIASGALRCYVMPYVDGESLRQRMDRERQLGIEQAVDIVRQVAAGLDYAHAHGVVHRDIKPENILLVGDQALIADFGLARALHAASSRPFTESGIAVGTPAYMSPEQAAAEPVDGRTDIYALGCLFFEMVAGMPPFRGATVAALMAAHATRQPPSLCDERASCPPAMDAAVQRALAKVPADRFRTAGEFAQALQHWRASAPPALPRGVRRVWLAWGAAAAALAGVGVVTPALLARVRGGGAPLDSTAVAVLPFTGGGGQALTARLARERLISAFSAWNGLRVVDAGDSAAGGSDARRVARQAGAARYVTAAAVSLGDSVELRAALFDTGSAPVRQAAVRVADVAAGGTAAYATLAARLLRAADGDENAAHEDASPGTHDVGAWRAYTRGAAARMRWSLAEAESAFREAVALDPSFARAHLWLGQVEFWRRPAEWKEWGEEAGRAMARSADLPDRDSLPGAGLAAMANKRFPEACEAYRAWQRTAPQSDLPWFGLASCLGMDGIVLPDRASPSGWRFRGGSIGSAAAIDSGLARSQGAPEFAFDMLGAMVISEPLRTRVGRALSPSTEHFSARPTILGDTVALVPYPDAVVQHGTLGDATRGIALQRNVQRLELAYRDWVRRAPRSAKARRALAQVEELQGRPEALTTLESARELTKDSATLVSLGIAAVRLQVKQGHLDNARVMADSLLRANPDPDGENALALAGVAALVGDLPRTTALLRVAARYDPQAVFQTAATPPPPVLDAGTSLLTIAASGACPDSLSAFPLRIDRLLLQYSAGEQRDEARRAIVVRPLSLAVPCLGAGAVTGLASRDPLVRMQQLVAAHDGRGARATFDSVQAARRGMRPGDISLDHTFQEAWVLLQLRDTAAAVRYLELPLTSLPTLNTHLLDDVPAAAALGRAMALRADLAVATGDLATARRSAGEVVALWSTASAEVQPVVARMRRIAAPAAAH